MTVGLWDYLTTGLQDYRILSKLIFSIVVWELILVKLSANAKIMMKQIFHRIENNLKGH